MHYDRLYDINRVVWYVRCKQVCWFPAFAAGMAFLWVAGNIFLLKWLFGSHNRPFLLPCENWRQRKLLGETNCLFFSERANIRKIGKWGVSYLQIFIVSSGLLRLRTPTLPLCSRNLIENPAEGTLAQLPCIWFNSRIEQLSGSKFLHQGIVWSGTLGGFLLSG